jgi:alcohol dehydrogenase
MHMATMAGVQLIGHGGPEMLVWNDRIPVPEPGPAEALVRVLAAGVNNTDINTRVGWYAVDVTGATAEAEAEGARDSAGGWAGAIGFPRIQGGDLCGEVVALGAGVSGLRVGMRVTCPINQATPLPGTPLRFVSLGSEFDGAFAQFCRVPADQLHDVTDVPLSDAEVAALPCGHGTALNLLRRAGVSAGERILVTGASGGVGLAAVELARLIGAEVTAVAAPAKHDAVRARGATDVIARGTRPARASFAAVIDVVGGPGFGALIEALVPGGRLAVAGAIAGPMVEVDLRRVYLGDLTILGCAHTAPSVFAELVGWARAGRVRPLVSRILPLAEIRTAQAEFLAKRHAGKIVLIPPPG